MFRHAVWTLLLLFAPAVYAQNAIPEEARRAFVQGSTLAKEAKTPEQQLLAVESFQKAVDLAPKWADALYNLAVAQELAGRYSDAQATLKRYIQTKPGEKEARNAQDRIYALEAKAELDSSARAAAEEAARASFAGTWRQVSDTHSDPAGRTEATIEIVQEAPGRWQIVSHRPYPDQTHYVVSQAAFNGRQLTFQSGTPIGYFRYSLTLADDGLQMTGTWQFFQYETAHGLGWWARRGQVPVTFKR